VLTGTPMVIIRLQGCGVGCPWCDTKETWKRENRNQQASFAAAEGKGPGWSWITPMEAAAVARSKGSKVGWALMTGGEPAEQDLAELVHYLHENGFSVALETSGTARGFEKCDFDWICISPKFDMPGGKKIDETLLRYADELKIVVASNADVERLMRIIENKQLNCDCVVSLQPASTNRKLTDFCVSKCIERDWRLSIQIHRYIDAR
jgi:7-carboxy-7-deazaguanine synthase